jgi:hypothetical protein
MTQRDVTLSITFTLDDIEVLRRIWNRVGYVMDKTGIIQHILNEYEMKADSSLNKEVKA